MIAVTRVATGLEAIGPRAVTAVRARVLEPVETLTLHAFGWLVAGNAVGLLLSVLLLAPGLGRVLGPLTYGRWVPVHFDIELYGWCGLVLTGLLYRIYLPRGQGGRLASLAVGVWSGSLLFGALSWLGGHSSGKPFLEWTGPARALLAANLALLEIVLVVAYVRRLRLKDAGQSLATTLAQGVLLAALAAVPLVMFRTAAPEVYPPINPDSGGATAGSLMGSSLGVVFIAWLTPLILGLPLAGRRMAWATGAAFALHFGWFLALDHGNHSHRELLQQLSLASLLAWLPLLGSHLRRFAWPAPARPWLAAFAGWGILLVCTGVVTGMPGVLERLKFTHALVGHAHLAMAGLATSLGGLVFCVLHDGGRLSGVLGNRRAFYLWHVGCGTFVVAMFALGAIEGAARQALYGADPRTDALLALRALAGVAMLYASTLWWRDLFGRACAGSCA